MYTKRMKEKRLRDSVERPKTRKEEERAAEGALKSIKGWKEGEFGGQY